MDNQMVVTPKTFFRSANILFMALVAGQLLFGLIAFALVFTQKTGGQLDKQMLDIAVWLIPALAIAGIAISWLFFNARLKVLRNKETLNEKLSGYQSAMLVRLAMMEGPSLLALILFYLSGDYVFLGVAAFVILAFLFNRPAKNKVIQQLQLHDDEKLQLEDDGFRP